MKIPFSPPYIDDDIRKEVLESLDSGWITTGPKVKELEKAISRESGIEDVVACNSATSGLMLVLHWFGVAKGDEVIIPVYTYAATALAVMHVGATPVMIDCQGDFNIDINKIEEKITDKTKVIIPVDIAGWPCDYERIHQITEKSKSKFKAVNDNQRRLGRILVLADAAHSIGATLNSKPSGSLTDISVFSFHAVKNITTAEGGAILLNLPDPFDNNEIQKSLKLWTLNGQTKDALAKTQGEGWKYDIVYPGFKMNMPDVLAAIGLAQLRKYKSLLLPERKRIFDSYINAFGKFEWAELPPLDTATRQSSYHLFALRIKNIYEAQRDEMIEHISDQGVSVNVHFQPLPLLTVFKNLGYDIKEYPNAFDNYSREISLPIYPQLDQTKIDFIVGTVQEAYHQVIHAKATC